MVTRIDSGRVQTPFQAFNPSSVLQAGVAGASAAAPVVAAAQETARQLDAFEQQEAEAFARVELGRLERDLASGIAELEQGLPESGAGYAAAARSRYQQLTNQALERAGPNPSRRRILQQAFERAAPDYGRRFDAAERQWGTDYVTGQVERSVDDAMQRVSRSAAQARQPRDPGGAGPERVGGVSFEYRMGPNRPNRPREAIITAIGRSAEEAFGPGTRVVITSGQENDADGDGVVGPTEQYGAHRHGTGLAADFQIYRPDGSRVRASGEEALRFAEIAIDNGVTGLGFGPNYMGGLNFHFDLTEPDFSKNQNYTWGGGTGGAGSTEYRSRLIARIRARRRGEAVDLRDDPVISSEIDAAVSQIDALPLPANQRAELARTAEANITRAAVIGLIDQDPETALAVLGSGQVDRYLTFEQDAAMQRAARSEMEQRARSSQRQMEAEAQTAARAQATDWVAWTNNGRQGEEPPRPAPSQEQYLTPTQQAELRTAPLVADAREAVLNAPPDQIGAVADSYRPEGEGYQQEQLVYEAARRTAEARWADVAIDSAAAAGVRPDTTAPGVRERLEDRFRGHMGAVAENEDAAANPVASAAAFVTAMRYVPEGFNTLVEQAMSSADHKVRAQAAREVDAAYRSDPVAFAGTGGRAMEHALTAGAFMANGLSPAEALSLADAAFSELNEGTRRARLDEFRKKDNIELSQTKFEELVANSPDAVRGAGMDPTVWGEFQDVAEAHYAKTGNMDAAVAVAARGFLATHAVTQIGGEARWARQPPEAMYAPDIDEGIAVPDIEAQALAWAKDEGVEAAEIVSVDIADGTIGSRRPLYAVTVTDQSGITHSVFGFRPDMSRARAHQERLTAWQTEDDVISAQMAEVRRRTLEATVGQRVEGVATSIKEGIGQSTAELIGTPELDAELRELRDIRSSHRRSRPRGFGEPSAEAMRRAERANFNRLEMERLTGGR